MSAAVEVAAFSSEIEARVCVSFLCAHGVAAELADDMTLSVLPFISPGTRGFRVMAPEEQRADARRLLTEIDNTTEQEGGV